jgi:hypothetical protein
MRTELRNSAIISLTEASEQGSKLPHVPNHLREVLHLIQEVRDTNFLAARITPSSKSSSPFSNCRDDNRLMEHVRESGREPVIVRNETASALIKKPLQRHETAIISF